MFHLDSTAQALASMSLSQLQTSVADNDASLTTSLSPHSPSLSDPTSVDVVGVLDSPLWMDVQPLYPDQLTPLQVQTEAIRVLANITSLQVVDEACAEMYPAASGQGWKCLYGQFRVDFLKTRYLLLAASFDSFQLEQLVGHEPSTDQEVAFAENFANLTRNKLSTLPIAATTTNTAATDCLTARGATPSSSAPLEKSSSPASTASSASSSSPLLLPAVSPSSGVYSQACYNHAISSSNLFFTSATSDGLTEAGALAAFIRNGQGVVDDDDGRGAAVWDVDQCASFSCGVGCVSN
jgi:hypothetical protein